MLLGLLELLAQSPRHSLCCRPLDAMPTDPRIGPFRVPGRGDRMQEAIPNPLRDIRRSLPDSLPDLVEGDFLGRASPVFPDRMRAHAALSDLHA
jgi:hypothetical protein